MPSFTAVKGNRWLDAPPPPPPSPSKYLPCCVMGSDVTIIVVEVDCSPEHHLLATLSRSTPWNDLSVQEWWYLWYWSKLWFAIPSFGLLTCNQVVQYMCIDNMGSIRLVKCKCFSFANTLWQWHQMPKWPGPANSFKHAAYCNAVSAVM